MILERLSSLQIQIKNQINCKLTISIYIFFCTKLGTASQVFYARGWRIQNKPKINDVIKNNSTFAQKTGLKCMQFIKLN